MWLEVLAFLSLLFAIASVPPGFSFYSTALLLLLFAWIAGVVVHYVCCELLLPDVIYSGMHTVLALWSAFTASYIVGAIDWRLYVVLCALAFALAFYPYDWRLGILAWIALYAAALAKVFGIDVGFMLFLAFSALLAEEVFSFALLRVTTEFSERGVLVPVLTAATIIALATTGPRCGILGLGVAPTVTALTFMMRDALAPLVYWLKGYDLEPDSFLPCGAGPRDALWLGPILSAAISTLLAKLNDVWRRADHLHPQSWHLPLLMLAAGIGVVVLAWWLSLRRAST